MSKIDIDGKRIIEACLQGDIIAQKAFYKLFAHSMYGVCLRYSKKAHEAEEMLQEAMFAVFRDLDTYRGSGSLEGWVRRVVVNTNLQSLRKKKIVYDFETDVLELQKQDHSYLDIFRKFEIEGLLESIRLLPEGCQVIFNLFVFEEYSHKEIADQLSISIGTSKSQLSKARRLLKETLIKESERDTCEK